MSDELLQACRGSVKSDLMRYEQMILSCTNGIYKTAYEAEANRLQALLDAIDAAAAQPAVPLQPQAEPDSRTCTCHPDDSPPIPCAKKYALSECRASHLAACAGGGATQPLTVGTHVTCLTAPERIWLQTDPECPSDEPPKFPAGDEVTWCRDRINKSDTLYIRADLIAHGIVEPARGDVLATGQMKKDSEHCRHGIRWENNCVLCASVHSGTEGGGK